MWGHRPATPATASYPVKVTLLTGTGRGRAGSAELVIAAAPRGTIPATPIKVVALATERGLQQQHAAEPLANISNTSEGLPAAELMASVYAQLPASAAGAGGEGAGAVLPLRLLKPEDAERVAKQAARAARLITSGDSSGLLSEHSTSGELPAQQAGAGGGGNAGQQAPAAWRPRPAWGAPPAWSSCRCCRPCTCTATPSRPARGPRCARLPPLLPAPPHSRQLPLLNSSACSLQPACCCLTI